MRKNKKVSQLEGGCDVNDVMLKSDVNNDDDAVDWWWWRVFPNVWGVMWCCVVVVDVVEVLLSRRFGRHRTTDVTPATIASNFTSIDFQFPFLLFCSLSYLLYSLRKIPGLLLNDRRFFHKSHSVLFPPFTKVLVERKPLAMRMLSHLLPPRVIKCMCFNLSCFYPNILPS